MKELADSVKGTKIELDELLNAFEELEERIDPHKVDYSHNLEILLNALFGEDGWEEDDQGGIIVGGEVFYYNTYQGRWVKLH